jgi:hypothetical protein
VLLNPGTHVTVHTQACLFLLYNLTKLSYSRLTSQRFGKQTREIHTETYKRPVLPTMYIYTLLDTTKRLGYYRVQSLRCCTYMPMEVWMQCHSHLSISLCVVTLIARDNLLFVHSRDLSLQGRI